MENQNHKLIVETLKDNSLKESSGSTAMAPWEPLIYPLLNHLYNEMLITQIADVQPTKSPSAKIAALYSIYTGDKSLSDGIHLETSRIIALDDTTGIAVGDSLTFSAAGAVAEVIFKEGTFLLVRIDIVDNAVPKILVTNTTDIGTVEVPDVRTVTYSSVNRTSIKKVFKNYSGPFLDDNSLVKNVEFEVRTILKEVKSRKIKSKFTKEKLQDYMAYFGVEGTELAGKTLSTEIKQEIDIETIAYLRDIATPMNDVVLLNSYGIQGDIMAVASDIYTNIYNAAEQIVRAIRKPRKMFVLADSSTCALLLTNPLHTKTKPDEENPYYVGKVGTLPLMCDFYSTDHYVLIGYMGEKDCTGDCGLIYSPYSNLIATAVDPDTFQEHFMLISRYFMTRHPQDTGTDIGDSDFFRIFSIDHGDGGNNFAV